MEPGHVFSFIFAASERGLLDAADFARVQFREGETLAAEVFHFAAPFRRGAVKTLRNCACNCSIGGSPRR